MRVQTHNTTGTNQLPKPRGWRLESERIERRRFLQVLGLTATALGTAACAPMAGSISGSGVAPSLLSGVAAPSNGPASARLAGPATTVAPAVPTYSCYWILRLMSASSPVGSLTCPRELPCASRNPCGLRAMEQPCELLVQSPQLHTCSTLIPFVMARS